MEVANDWLIDNARERRTRFLKARWRPLTLVLFLGLIAIIVNHLVAGFLDSPRWLLGFFDGIALAGSLGGCWFLAYELDGGKRYRDGLYGERQTVAALRRFSEWELFHVRFEHVDADVVAVSEAGVFVFESKYTSGEWRIESDRLVGPIQDPIPQSLDRAKRVGWLLSSREVKVQTTPVVILWGPHLSPSSEAVMKIDGVQVVLGGAAKDWVHRLEGSPINRETVEASVKRLKRYTSEFRSKKSTAA